jgi:hypothetical protein
MKLGMACVLLVGLCGFPLIPSVSLAQQPDKRIDELHKQQDRLKREKDPVGHTKTQIQISEILLSFISDAVKNSDFDAMQQRLDEYCAAIDDALQTMVSTGRDANRHPGGFKDLEIALRRHDRQLDGFGQALTFEQREPVLKAKAAASAIHDRLIRALLLEDIHAQAGKS